MNAYPQVSSNAMFHDLSCISAAESPAPCPKTVFRHPSLLLPRLLRIAAHNLNLLRRNVILIIELEIDVLDEERPDLVAEPVGVQMTLFGTLCQL